MKKYVLVASVILTLAGCSASAVIADSQNASVTPSNTVKETTAPEVKKFSAQELIKEAKLERNTIRMQELIDYLKTRVGKTSYVFSGASPYGWDCSGMVRWTYGQFGLEIPHSANKQGHLGERVSEPKLGDIVVFAYNGSTSFYHSAIYIGNGEIINAHYGADTTIIQPLSDYKNNQIRFVRIVKTN
jgi:cell wall-associated NlpC family hydrolase